MAVRIIAFSGSSPRNMSSTCRVATAPWQQAGWLSGAIYDLTGSYQAAFLNGIAWNLLNMSIAFWLLLGRFRPRRMAA